MLKKITGKASQLKNKISSNKDYRELLVDSSLAFIVRSGAAVAAFIMNVVIARYLEINASGLFFLSLSIITIVSTVVRFGADNVVLRFVGIYSNEGKWVLVRGTLYYILGLVMAASIVVTALILLFSKAISVDIFGKLDLESPLFWISLSIPCIAASTIIAMALQGVNKILHSVYIQNVFIPLGVILLVFVLKPHTASKMSLMYFVASIITLVISIVLWLKFVPNGEIEINKKLLISSCTPLWIVAILQQAMQWGGQFIAGIYCHPDVLAQLAVAQRTSMLISFIGVAINLVSAPKFASFYNQGKLQELKRYAINTTRIMILFATPILIFVYVFPDFILSVFGKGFKSGALMLQILATGQYINVITGSVGYLLMMSGHNKEFRNINIISGIISIVLSLTLVRFYGGVGAAIAIALAVAIQNILAVGIVEKKLGFNTLKVLTLNMRNKR
jgi:O-antigen/teichoic acid export membrane protein